MYATARIVLPKMYAAARILLGMYSIARIRHTVPVLFPIDAVFGQVLAENGRDHFGSLFPFDASDQVQLRVHVGIEIERASVA